MSRECHNNLIIFYNFWAIPSANFFCGFIISLSESEVVLFCSHIHSPRLLLPDLIPVAALINRITKLFRRHLGKLMLVMEKYSITWKSARKYPLHESSLHSGVSKRLQKLIKDPQLASLFAHIPNTQTPKHSKI